MISKLHCASCIALYMISKSYCANCATLYIISKTQCTLHDLKKQKRIAQVAVHFPKQRKKTPTSVEKVFL